jgi:RsiW-degrading membrane proteinase PrsW (M82 family)
MPFSHAWLPYIYLYGVGGLLFGSGLLITIKSGSLDLKRLGHKNWLVVLIFGFIWFMVMHFIWNLAALEILSLKVSVVIWIVFMIVSLGLGYFKLGKKARA